MSTQPSAAEVRPERSDTRFDTPSVLTLAAGHFIHDTYPAFLGPLLPLLIPKLGLSLAVAGTLAALLRWSSVIQPFLGYWADRTDARYWVIFAPTLTAMGMSLLGLAPSYLAVVFLLVLTSLSHAAFHPAAGAMVTRASGATWGRGTSYFMTGGELGRALGPLLIVASVQAFGLEGAWIAMGPGVVASLLLYFRLGRSPKLALKPPQGSFKAALRQAWPPLLLLGGAIICRSLVTVGFATFLPTYMTGRGSPLVMAGLAVSVFELAGAAGAFVGGTLSDRLGRRAVMVVSQLAAAPLLLGVVLVEPGIAQLVLLAVAGAALLSQGPVQLALIQELLPENRSTATGILLFLGLEGAIVGAIALGAIGDAFGLGVALVSGVLVSLLAVPLLLALPEMRRTADQTL